MTDKEFTALIFNSLNPNPEIQRGNVKRIINKLVNAGFERKEITIRFNDLLEAIQASIESIYNSRLRTYEKRKIEDENLPKENKYYYPKPVLNEIWVTKIDNLNGVKIELPKRLNIIEVEHLKQAIISIDIKPNYIKHPDFLELLSVPSSITHVYSQVCRYDYINIEGFGEIPVPKFSLNSLIAYNIELETIPLSEYAKGFIEGYHSNFTPFIDTNQTKIELILQQAVLKGEKSFPKQIDKTGVTFPEMFNSGLFEGKRYKAWEIILDTPSAFLHEFEPLPSQQTETETEQETENDFTLSTIEDWLFEFKVKMNETDYQSLVSALMQYFQTGKFPTLSKPIQINGKPNKKLFGWALNRIFEAKGKGVEKELLQFAKQNISLFTEVQFDENKFRESNLYKYFTTKTK